MNVAQVRRAMLAGIAFVVLLVAGVLIYFGDTPEIKSSDSAATAAQKWLGELSTSGHRVWLIVSAYVLVVAAIAFVWFCNGLRSWLASDSTAGRAITALSAAGAGVIGVAAIAGGAGIAGGVEFGEVPLPQNGETIRVVSELFFPLLFVVFALASAGIIAVATTVAARSSALPRWLVYAGWLGVLGSIASVAFVPFVLPLLWYLAIAVVGFTRAQAGRSALAPTPPQSSPGA